MESEDLQLVVVLLIAALTFVFGGYHLGRRVEKHYWVKYLPQQMNDMCLECAGLKSRTE